MYSFKPNITVTIVKIIIAYAKIKRKLQYIADSAKINSMKRNC
jgi:hypothetical protein